MEAFMAILSEKLGSFFDLTFHNLCPNKRSPIFGELGTVTTAGRRCFGNGLEGGSGHGVLMLWAFWGSLGKTRHLRLSLPLPLAQEIS